MTITSSGSARWRTRAVAAGVAAAIFLAGAPLIARAATTRVAECGTTDDASVIQAEIDASSPGDTVAISGTCDLSTVPAHGGDVWSITDAAVVVDKAITITSAGDARSAVLRGSGQQAAILVAPQGDGATIKGLTFDLLGRAVVVWNASDVTIGAAGGINNDNANRITGGPTMNQAILALSNWLGADDVYGRAIVDVAGRPGPVTMSLAGENLTNLKVLGNYISYAPAGEPDPTAYDIVAIDVRQRTPGADGIQIQANAVGMGTSEFPSTNMNGVRVFAHSLEPITDVNVDGNNLGRTEELEGTPAEGAADVQAAGRVGILLHRVEGFSVNGNGVRVRLSPTAIPMPGGGIVVADSSDGHINDNGIIELADPSTAAADLGAIGVIDDFAKLFGNRVDTLPTADIGIEGNIIGLVNGESPGIGAQKGIVLNGVVRPFVTDNTVKFSSLDAINIGTAVSGPGDPTVSPGVQTLQGTVAEAIVCHNFLDVTGADEFSYDAQEEITAEAVTGSAYPGGYSAVNSDCFPTVTLDPATGPVGVGQDLVVNVATLPNYDIAVNLNDSDPGQPPAHTPNLLKDVHVGPTGRGSATYTAAELQGQKDGILSVTALVYLNNRYWQDTATTTLAAHPTGLPAGTVTLNDGPDAFTNASEAHANMAVSWTTASDPRVTSATVWFADSSGNAPAGCGPKSVGVSGTDSLSAACADQLDDGPYTFNARWHGTGGLTSATSSVLSTMDTTLSTPVITSPAANFVSGTDTVSVSGSGDAGDSMAVTIGGVTKTVAVNGAGAWTTQFTLIDGVYSVKANATDAAGNRASSLSVPFRVITSGTAPVAPVVTTPANDADVPGTFSISGTATAGNVVVASIGGIELGRGTAAPSGAFTLSGTRPDGTYVVDVVATDNVARTSPAVSLTLHVDGTRPTVAAASPDLVNAPGAVTLSGTAADNRKVATVVIQMTNAVTGANVGAPIVATCSCGANAATWTASVTAAPGVYTAVIASIDSAGNVSTYQRVTFVKTG
ncbi:MAG: Ig-like domain-containing protein [Microthrixaceae bacterium]